MSSETLELLPFPSLETTMIFNLEGNMTADQSGTTLVEMGHGDTQSRLVLWFSQEGGSN